VEDTFLHDLPTLTSCQAELKRLYQALLKRHEKTMKKQNIVIKALYVKIRFHNFQTTTAQKTSQQLELTTFNQLISTAWERQQKPVRLLGLGIQYQQDNQVRQIDLNF
jgi:DNA polymerase-4